MIGREQQSTQLREALSLSTSTFIAVTGRRRVGKTYLVDQVYGKYICLRVTGIQGGNLKTQLGNFAQKIAIHANWPLVTIPQNWQQVFILLRQYLATLPTHKKQVIFLDELPWMDTPKSGFVQLLAHFWNDYLSKESQFVLVVCGSSTSWITRKIVNDKGGFHNRLTHRINLKPFTLSETNQFLRSKSIKLSDASLAELYMAMGGIPFYLNHIRKGESPTVCIERMCFSDDGILRHEYDNLYKALFDSPTNHEAIVDALAGAKAGLARSELAKKSKVSEGGPFQRALDDLLISGFVAEEIPFGKKKRGSIYRLIDEYSVFYHRFIKGNRKLQAGIWQTLSASQSYKIWTGYAFETLCIKHVDAIKRALGIQNVYTETCAFRYENPEGSGGFQIDLMIDRKDQAINLCECKFYESSFEISRSYASILQERKAAFRVATNTKKNCFTTLITNHPLKKNEYSLEAIDVAITISELL